VISFQVAISESCSLLLQVPSKEHYSAIAYFISYNKFEEGSVGDRFLKGDDAFKNTRLKLIANISEGPWIVKKAVGEQAICILGRSLTCRSHSHLSYFSITCIYPCGLGACLCTLCFT
jgi:hypothetical protein